MDKYNWYDDYKKGYHVFAVEIIVPTENREGA